MWVIVSPEEVYRFKTVHPRHGHVHQEQVGTQPLGGIDRFLPILSLAHDFAFGFGQQPEKKRIDS
jgi:hypothetical protein